MQLSHSTSSWYARNTYHTLFKCILLLAFPFSSWESKAPFIPSRELRCWDSNRATGSTNHALPHDTILPLFNKSESWSSQRSVSLKTGLLKVWDPLLHWKYDIHRLFLQWICYIEGINPYIHHAMNGLSCLCVLSHSILSDSLQPHGL